MRSQGGRLEGKAQNSDGATCLRRRIFRHTSAIHVESSRRALATLGRITVKVSRWGRSDDLSTECREASISVIPRASEAYTTFTLESSSRREAPARGQGSDRQSSLTLSSVSSARTRLASLSAHALSSRHQRVRPGDPGGDTRETQTHRKIACTQRWYMRRAAAPAMESRRTALWRIDAPTTTVAGAAIPAPAKNGLTRENVRSCAVFCTASFLYEQCTLVLATKLSRDSGDSGDVARFE